MTIPADVLKLLDVDVGSTLQLDVENGAIRVRPIGTQRRYTLAELLRGTTPAFMSKLNSATEWARDGSTIGREL